MKLGMPILYEYETIEDNIKLAKELGLDFIENNLNFSYGRNALENPEHLNKILEDANLFQTLHFYDETDFASYEEVTEAYLKLLEKYVTLGSKCRLKMLNVHLNKGPVCTISGVKNYIYTKEFDAYKRRLLNALNKARNICEKNGVILVIENVNHNAVIPYLDDAYRFLNEEGFYFNYDIGHDSTNSFQLRKLNEELNLPFKEFHFHDSDGKRDHLSLGDGTIDLKYFKALAQKNDANVLLEVKSSDDLKASVPVFKNL
ncbi:MAG: sugar phosphate isomerase/epimerase family protein [Anaeroplasmataceae bacterium]